MIKGLTDRGAAFPRVGVLRKGGEKTDPKRPGPDLKHFRFDTDDDGARAAFQQAYGDEPRQITVHLPFATAAENFEAWREAWSASSLQHRCDGETMTRWLTDKGTYSDDPRPCTGDCKPVGRLMVIIPELRRLAYVTVQTTSIHDIMELQQNLEAAELLRGDLRGIPFVLSRRPRQISTPRADGKRARVEKWLLAIEPAPVWVGYQLQAMERAALPAGTLKALPDGQHVNTVTGEIIDAPAFEDEPEPEPAPPPSATPALNRPAAIRKIKSLWARERDLIETYPAEEHAALMQEQNRETDLDLENLSAEALIQLGRTVNARVEFLPTMVEDDAVTT